jgi:membrane protein DedA with SNARE-associated domain
MFKRLLIKFSTRLGITPEELKRAALLPLGLLALVIMGDLVWSAFGLPDTAATIAIIKNLFMLHGYPLVFAAAAIEALLLIGLYVPGSVALVLAATMAGQGVLNIWAVIALITLGMLVGVVINYFLGKYGWYRLLARFGLKDAIERTKIKTETKGYKVIHASYFNPNIASLTATSFGILHVNFWKFFMHSVIAFTYWNLMWGISFYLMGNWIEDRLNYTSFIIVIVAAIFVRVGYVMVKKKFRSRG